MKWSFKTSRVPVKKFPININTSNPSLAPFVLVKKLRFPWNELPWTPKNRKNWKDGRIPVNKL